MYILRHWILLRMRTHTIHSGSPSLYVPYPWYVSCNHLSSTQGVHFMLWGLLRGSGGHVPEIKLEYMTDKPTTWSRVLPEKLTVPQLDKKCLSWYGNRRFITALKTACNLSLSLSWVRAFQPYYLILFCHLCLGNWSGLFPSDLLVGNSTVSHPCTCRVHSILL